MSIKKQSRTPVALLAPPPPEHFARTLRAFSELASAAHLHGVITLDEWPPWRPGDSPAFSITARRFEPPGVPRSAVEAAERTPRVSPQLAELLLAAGIASRPTDAPSARGKPLRVPRTTVRVNGELYACTPVSALKGGT